MLLILSAASPAFAQATRGATSERNQADIVAATLAAAASTQAAEQQLSGDAIRGLRRDVSGLEAAVAAGRATIAALTISRERLIGELGRRDAHYAQEIAVFRAAVQDIAATLEGAAILAERRPGNLRAAREALLALIDRRNAVEARAANIRQAANLRTGATIALDDRAKGEATTNEVIALFERVLTLDAANFWDHIELSRLYTDAGRLDDAERVASRALNLSTDRRTRGVALTDLADVLILKGDLARVRTLSIEALSLARAEAEKRPDDLLAQGDLSVSLQRMGNLNYSSGAFNEAISYYNEALALDQSFHRRFRYVVTAQYVCSDGISLVDSIVAIGDVASAQRYAESTLQACSWIAGQTGSNADRLQVAYALWRQATINAASNRVAEARRGLDALKRFAAEVTAADPTNRRLAGQAILLTVAEADLDLLEGRIQSSLQKYDEAVRQYEDLRRVSGFGAVIDTYEWLIRVRLATMPGSTVEWVELADGLPHALAAGGLSALDILFINRARSGAKSTN